VAYRVGGRMPLHATGVGLVLLAHAAPEIQSAVLGGELGVEDVGAPPSADDLRRTLARIRREGTAIKFRAHPEPMTSVAAPVFGPRQIVIAALSVVAPEASFEPVALKPAVIAVARAISRAMRTTRDTERNVAP
jgi:DNA-binding IclR family transcriptional regulator